MSGTMTTTATPGTGTGRERGTTRRTGTETRDTERIGIGRNGTTDRPGTTTRKTDMRGILRHITTPAPAGGLARLPLTTPEGITNLRLPSYNWLYFVFFFKFSFHSNSSIFQ